MGGMLGIGGNVGKLYTGMLDLDIYVAVLFVIQNLFLISE